LPDGELFRQRIVNHLPRSPKLAPAWLQAVADAAEWGHEGAAVWIGRELVRDPRAKLGHLRLISLFAWFSDHPTTTGFALMARRWEPEMRFAAALEAAQEWRTRIALQVRLGERPIADMWLSPGYVYGFDFVALRTAEDIAAEAAAMRNCLCSYGASLAHNRSRLWSVRMNGRRVATLCIANGDGDPLINIVEMRAADNADVSADVSWAAREWLNRHDLSAVRTNRLPWNAVPFDRSAWISLWRPYWLAKRHIPAWLPLRPSWPALKDL